jgi:chromate transport protein ChrA
MCSPPTTSHLGKTRRIFVTKIQWITPKTYADLFALGNALPGPGSTQLAFSIACVRNGTLAGFLAFGLWSSVYLGGGWGW